MKLKLIPILVGASALAIAAAPVRVGAEERAQPPELVADLARCLNLTSEQPAPITPICQQASVQVQSLQRPEQLAQLKTVQQQDGHELAIMSALNLSSAQKAQLQQIDPGSPEQIESILTPGQRQRWLQMRRAYSGGR